MRKDRPAEKAKPEISPEQRESIRVLAQIARQSETIGTSALARSTVDPSGHQVETGENAIEKWGTRIGRGLGLIACIVLGVYLLRTYVL